MDKQSSWADARVLEWRWCATEYRDPLTERQEGKCPDCQPLSSLPDYDATRPSREARGERCSGYSLAGCTRALC